MSETKAQKAERDQIRDDWRRLLQDAGFRRILWSILNRGKVYDAGFVGDALDTYRQGERKAALQIIQDMNAARPTAYAELLLEAATREAERQTPKANDERTDDE